MSVLWSGGLAVTWERAVARAGGEAERLLEVGGYQVELFSGRGEGRRQSGGVINPRLFVPEGSLVRRVSLPPATTQLELLGLRLSSDYLLTLSCHFPGQPSLQCGRRTVRISLPDLVLASLVYRRLEVARSWGESQLQCSQAGGHLVSLGHNPELESLLLSTIPLSDIWTGGNICPDSPGGSISTLNSLNL